MPDGMPAAAQATSVLLIGRMQYATKEWESCSSLLNLQDYCEGSRDDFISKCQAGEFDNVLVICRSNEWTRLTGPFDRELLRHLPNSVRFICHNGAGYDTIDVGACNNRGISVSYTPGRVNDATADMAMLLLLSALRRITIPFQAVRRKSWKGQTQPGYDPEGKTLGILGMGGIGCAVAKRALAFDMKVQYHNRNPLRTNPVPDARYVSLDELLQTSDVLSLNLSFNPTSEHIISKPEFEKMKDGVVIVNTSRGKVIDEDALVKALRSGKVYSAGLDVFESEPGIHPGLLDNENVVLLPHIATCTYETRRSMELLVLDNLREAVQNNQLVTPIVE